MVMTQDRRRDSDCKQDQQRERRQHCQSLFPLLQSVQHSASLRFVIVIPARAATLGDRPDSVLFIRDLD